MAIDLTWQCIYRISRQPLYKST